jgi:hypothetical protein
MAIYTFPSALMLAASLKFNLRPFQTRPGLSPFTAAAVTSGPIAEFWQVELTTPELTATEFRSLRAFCLKLRGQQNQVRFWDRSAPLQGAGGATSTINVKTEAAAGATSVTLKNLLASEATTLAADDRIGIGSNLYMVAGSASSDVNGEATVEILPPLRKAVAADDPVNTLDPMAVFVLADGLDTLERLPSLRAAPVQLIFAEVPDYV